MYDSLARQRFASTMLGAFAVFALLLAAVGLYGVMSHLVTQSTHDIGVLVTLGARPGNIIGLVVRQGMQLAAIGIAVGLAGALGVDSRYEQLAIWGERHRCAHLRDSAGAIGGGSVCRDRHSGVAGDASGSDGRVARRIAAVSLFYSFSCIFSTAFPT